MMTMVNAEVSPREGAGAGTGQPGGGGKPGQGYLGVCRKSGRYKAATGAGRVLNKKIPEGTPGFKSFLGCLLFFFSLNLVYQGVQRIVERLFK
jgi:hypothetical protein